MDNDEFKPGDIIFSEPMEPFPTERDLASEKLRQFCWCAGPTCSGCGANSRKIFNTGWNQALTSSVVKQMAEALEGMMKLLDDGVLVRNTDDDADIMKFTKQGARLIGHLQAAQTARTAYEQALKEGE